MSGFFSASEAGQTGEERGDGDGVGEVEGVRREGRKQNHEKNGSRNETTFREGVNSSPCYQPPAIGLLIGSYHAASNVFLEL